MSLFVWGAEFRVGVRDIDEQHKRIVDLINELHDAMVQGRAPAAVGRVLDEAVACAREHFHTEEDLMTRFGFPDGAEHARDHEQFLVRAAEFQRRQAGGECVALEAAMYLVEWLASHHQGADEDLGKHLRACGVT